MSGTTRCSKRYWLHLWYSHKEKCKRLNNYLSENLKEPVVVVTIRYSKKKSYCNARMLSRSCYKDSVRVFDRYALIEVVHVNTKWLWCLFKKSSSEMLDQQTNFCLDKDINVFFMSMNWRVEKTLKELLKI